MDPPQVWVCVLCSPILEDGFSAATPCLGTWNHTKICCTARGVLDHFYKEHKDVVTTGTQLKNSLVMCPTPEVWGGKKPHYWKKNQRWQYTLQLPMPSDLAPVPPPSPSPTNFQFSGLSPGTQAQRMQELIESIEGN